MDFSAWQTALYALFSRGIENVFIELPGWPIFNFADSFICVAGAMMVFLAFRNVPLEGHIRRG